MRLKHCEQISANAYPALALRWLDASSMHLPSHATRVVPEALSPSGHQYRWNHSLTKPSLIIRRVRQSLRSFLCSVSVPAEQITQVFPVSMSNWTQTAIQSISICVAF
jgi:hypothetical protein